jgi:actin related protein 2/3 complex subunit 2
MILLESANRILGETIQSQIVREQSAEGGDSKREPIDVRLSDFDDSSYRVQIEKDNRSIMKVSLSLPCFRQFADQGGKEAVERHYPGLSIEPESGFDVTLSVNLDDIKGKPEDLITKLSNFKSNVLGGVFDYFFSNLVKGGKPYEKFKFDLRSDTTIFFLPGADRVTIIYSMDFKERVDRAVAKVFLQEFVDARRTLGAAPPVAYGTNPPLELKEFGITEPTGNLGFVTFSVLKSHLDGGKKEKVIAVLQSFRNYIQYHIKCSKSFFHSRMRARVASLLQVLNRAKHEPIGDNQTNKKTITGKTFTRAS